MAYNLQNHRVPILRTAQFRAKYFEYRETKNEVGPKDNTGLIPKLAKWTNSKQTMGCTHCVASPKIMII
eukprot:scaffold105163_cov27-Attheya_sp.AAC.1